MTPALNDLVRRGLINRARVTADRRSYQLTLTSQGEVALRRLREAAERHERNLDRIVGQRDRTRLLDILRKIRVELGSLAV
jgi:DNA-binding MarR family transcriptional regulator